MKQSRMTQAKADAAGNAGRERRRGGKRRALAVDPDIRHRMIAEAAYYIAEKRHFQGGDPFQDWLDAEVMIDQALLAANGKPRLALQFLDAELDRRFGG